MHGDKIRSIRMMRGFTQEYMADQLHIAQNTYSKYETNGTKITIETIEKIARVLGVSAADLISNTPIIINNQTSNHGTQGIGHVENLIDSNKDILMKVILSKDDEIQNLKGIIESLKNVIERLSSK